MAESTAREMISEWWKQTTEDMDSVDLNHLSDACMRQMLDTPGFADRFAYEFARQMIYQIGLRSITRNKSDLRQVDEHVYQNREGLLREIKRVEEEESGKWGSWFELDNSSKDHISLTKMNKKQLLETASKYESQGVSKLKDSAMMIMLAGKLNDTQIVEDVWKESQIDKIREGIEIKFSYGLKGVDRSIERAA